MPTKLPSIVDATKDYERWLGQQMPLVSEDLREKHRSMRKDPLSFLRATFYRWSQLWPVVCPDLTTAPVVLAVGDLHLENFGTWRDPEGRLIWGVNDFDEAYRLPYTQDLVRLAVSAKVAIDEHHLNLKPRQACDAILTGYMKALRTGGEPFVLSERHIWLGKLAYNSERAPRQFWAKLKNKLRPVEGVIPQQVHTVLQALMPASGLKWKIQHGAAGLGSLGRPRYTALTQWQGGIVAREAKALTPSACAWARTGRVDVTIFYQSIMDHAVRCRDPFVHVQGHWLVRRLSPHCSRIELESLTKTQDEDELLEAMGFETANVHLGTPKMRRVVLQDLGRRKGKWLRAATKAMTEATITDWKAWKSRKIKAR